MPKQTAPRARRNVATPAPVLPEAAEAPATPGADFFLARGYTEAEAEAEAANRADNAARAAARDAAADATQAEAAEAGSTPTEAEAPATEAPAAPEADKAAERAADRLACRILAGNLIRAFDAGRKSVPLKPVSGFKRKPLQLNRPAGSVDASERQAAYLAVAILASGQRVPVSADAEPVTFPRTFTARDADGITRELTCENGCGCDVLVSGLATLAPDSVPCAETLTVNAKAGQRIAGKLGSLLTSDMRA